MIGFFYAQELINFFQNGIDEVTKEEYAKNLEGNIKNLLEKLRKHSYKPQPVRLEYVKLN